MRALTYGEVPEAGLDHLAGQCLGSPLERRARLREPGYGPDVGRYGRYLDPGRQVPTGPAFRKRAEPDRFDPVETHIRRRHVPPIAEAPLPPKGRKREMTVYECDSCGGRELDLQRCEVCNSWMRAVASGISARAAKSPYR